MPRGSAALQLLENGRVICSDMGGGVRLRLKNERMEALHEGQFPVPACSSGTWMKVSVDANAFYKYEWTIDEEEDLE